MQDLPVAQHMTAQPERVAGRFSFPARVRNRRLVGLFRDVHRAPRRAHRGAVLCGGGIYVWGAVITVFMLALALGVPSWAGACPAQSTRRRLGALLGIAALSALPIVLFGEPILESISAEACRIRVTARFSRASRCFSCRHFCPAWCIRQYAVRLLVTQASTSGASAGWLVLRFDFR